MRTIKFCVCLLVILLGLWFLPRLIPVQSYVDEAEKQVSSAIGAPVTITQAHVALLPTPRLNIGQLTIGSPAAVEVRELAITPHLRSLFSTPRVVDIAAASLSLTGAAISAYPQVMQRLQSQPSTGQAPVVLNAVQIQQLDVRDVAGLPMLALAATFVDNQLTELHLNDAEQHLRVALTPAGDTQQLSVDIKDFVWAKYPHLMIDQGHVAGVLSSQKIRIDTLELGLLGGQVSGRGGLSWQPKAMVDGQFQFQQLAMEALSKVPTGKVPSMYLSGKLSGQAVLHGAAGAINQLSERITLQGEAKIARGVLHGIDLSQVANMLLKQSAQSGETQFDTLHTDFHVHGERVDFKQLVMQSGLLRATGQVAMLKDQLDGKVTVAVKGTAGALEVPLSVSGPVASPSVLPTKGAMVGAAVGTAILPGVGTGLGLKAGNQLQQWFGGQ